MDIIIPIITSEKTKHKTARTRKTRNVVVKKVLKSLFTAGGAFSSRFGIIFEKTETTALWNGPPMPPSKTIASAGI